MPEFRKKDKRKDYIYETFNNREEILKVLWEILPDAITILDIDGNIVNISESAIKIAGAKSINELIGRNFIEFIEPNYRDKAKKLIKRIREINSIKNIEFKLLKIDGTPYFGRISAGIIKDKNDKPSFIIVTTVDITSEKKAESELKKSENKYRNLYENALVGLWTSDVKTGKFIRMNNVAAELIGIDFKKSIVNDYKVADFFSKEHIKDFYRILKKKGEVLDYEVEFINKKGVVKFICIAAKYLKDIDQVEGVFIDVTRLKKIERELSEAKRMLQMVMDNIPQYIFWKDRDCVYMGCNQNFAQIAGLENVEDIIGKTDYDLPWTKEEADYFRKVDKRIMETGIAEYCLIEPIHLADGKEHWVDKNKLPLFNDQGNVVGILGTFEDITERMRTEEKLEETEEKFRILTDQSLLGIAILQDDIVKYINERYAELLGYTREEIKSWGIKEWIKTVHPDDLRFVYEQARKKQKGDPDVVNHYEYKAITKDGETKWFDLYSKTIIYNEKPADFITIIDITDRKLAEQELQKSEEKYRVLFEEAPFSILILDLNRNIIDVNPTTEEILGYNKEELVGKKLEELPLVDYIAHKKLLENFDKVTQNEEIKNFELKFYRKDGKIIWLNLAPALFSIENEMFVQIIIHDVSERVKAELEIMESERKFRAIFDSIPDLFFLITADTTIIDFKGREEDLYVENSKILGNRLIDLLPENLAKKVELLVKNVLKNKKPRVIEYQLPIKNVKRFFEARFLPFESERIAIFIRDITKRKEGENLIKEELKKLKELEQLRKDLISRVSHELKTPLMSISGASELLHLMFNEKFNDEIRELLTIIEKGSKRLTGLVGNLLDISRLDFKRLRLDLKEYNFPDIIKECVEEMSFFIKQRELNITLNTPKKLILKVDKFRIIQVINNLLSNAAKNTPPKGKIEISLERIDKWAIISVSDTGVGFTEDEIKKIFTRFGKIERYGEGLEYLDLKGSGLGLYISKQIIELHGGKIWVESDGRNKGSTFIFRLPLK